MTVKTTAFVIKAIMIMVGILLIDAGQNFPTMLLGLGIIHLALFKSYKQIYRQYKVSGLSLTDYIKREI